MHLPSRQDWSFALVTFAAAMLALYIAFAANLDRPYWAAATVYIVSQRTSGALNAKALWRLVGTLCGAAVAVAVIPNLIDAPPLLIITMTAWIALCLAGSLLEGGLRGYAFMLAGYTAAIVGFPAVDTPAAIWDTAVARVEEIGLGIVCSHLLHSVFLARSVNPTLHAAINAWMRDLVALAQATLGHAHKAHPSPAEWRRFASHVGAIDQIVDQARYERADTRLLSDMQVLRSQVRRCGLLMTSVTARLANLGEHAPALYQQAEPLVNEIGGWLVASMPDGRPSSQVGPAPLLQKLEAELAAQSQYADWGHLIYAGLCDRGLELVRRWRDCIDLAQGVPASGPAPPTQRGRRGHLDPLLVMLSCLAVAISLVAVCTFWRYSAWPSGSVAVMMAAVAGSIFAHMDDPAPAIGTFLIGNAISVVVAGVFLFGVFPMIDGFPLLAYCLGLFFIPAAAFLGNASIAPWLTPLLIGIFPSMSLQESSNADFVKFANNGLATVLGIGCTLGVTLVMRSVSDRQRIARLNKADRRDLARIAAGRRAEEHDEVLDRMLDRFEAVAIRMSNESTEAAGGLALGDLRAALNTLGLQNCFARMDGHHRGLLGTVLEAIAGHATGERPPADTLRTLDQAMASGAPWQGAGEREALLDLVGLRLALFPQDAPPTPEASWP
ncbi:FUSC family protein [Dyella sp. C9]|uniref:FUSC family protein n=1 Tax=Dyella sp. C9 TaxID=2202154 RepID=UPI000DEF6A73|nr:FUSC family protein [Dyella sp. C9]